MSDSNGKTPDDRDDDDLPDLSGMAEQMRQFIGPDGQLSIDKLMGGMREALGRVPGGADPASGLNWKATTSAINRLVGEAGDEPTSTLQAGDVTDAFGLANRWLDEATAFDGDTLQLELWTRTRWVERTTDQWRSMCAPIVVSLGDALVAMTSENVSGMPELAPLADMMAPMMRATAGEFYSTRLSKTVADLACSTLSGTDAALPLVAAPTVALLPGNVAAFTAGLSAPPTDVLVYLLARECARQRLFSASPWLGPQIMALIEHYARELTIDASALREGFDPETIEAMTPARLAEISSQIEARLFRPATTDEQKAILTRLETLICLVEGWVDHVVGQAAGPWLKAGPALAETLVRRRAVGGPAERALNSLLGVTLSSRRVRDATNLWAAIDHDRGFAQRDALWAHPDILPQAADLDDVMGFVARTGAGAPPDAMDEQLNWLVDQWRKDGAS